MRESARCGIVLDPENEFFQVWDGYTVVLLIYTAFFTPFQVLPRIDELFACASQGVPTY